MTKPQKRAATGNVAAGRAALDVMLTDAALDDGGRRRFIDAGSAAKFAGSLARKPKTVADRVGGFGSELVQVATGNSELRAPKSDRRFNDKAWQQNWALHRLMQAYLALGLTVDELIDDADLEFKADRRVRFTLGNVLDAIAPTNFPLTNPTVLKETVDRGGENLAVGARRLARDLSKRRTPALVDSSQFNVGVDLGLTPGSVVQRTEVFELIQYKPQTESVYEQPLVIVPPTINKYYVLDLAPGRSIAEYLVQQGFQVFMVSWRNPEAEQANFDFDTYADAVLAARGAAAQISGHPSVHVMAACSGGIISAGAAGHLAAEGRADEIASLTLMVCAIDNDQAGTTAALASRETAAAAIAKSARQGYLEGEALATVFAWLRPNDLIWSSAINNYLLGRPLPSFDILYWNNDTVRLAAGLHRDFVMMALDNALATPGEFTVLGTPVDLGQVDLDSYIVAGSNDHIVPWESAYRSTQLLGGQSRFVLSTSGHIQALVNPPSPESRASFRTADLNPAGSDEWEAVATTRKGSWWPDYVAWLGARAGAQQPAPQTLGSELYRATGKAPGTYVLAS